jgi:ribonuclease PH
MALVVLQFNSHQAALIPRPSAVTDRRRRATRRAVFLEIKMRPSRRAPDELRPVSIERNVARYAEGSCLIKFGETHVLCTASLEEKPPSWLRGTGKGWVTAEYAMLPRATHERTRRESTSGKPSGRTQEIQRLVGRSLRAVVDLVRLGEKQITIDCDVLQADGGTRTASITGGFIALQECVKWMMERKMLTVSPIKDHVAAISCGISKGVAVLDLDYVEDSEAMTDANFVMTGAGGLVEIQGTAEGAPFSEAQFLEMMALARKGIGELVELQKKAVA